MLILLVIGFATGLITGWSIGKRHRRLSSGKTPKMLEPKRIDPLEEAREAADPYFRLLDGESEGSEKKVFHTHTLELAFERFGFPRKTTLFGPDEDVLGLHFVASFGFMYDRKRKERSLTADPDTYTRVPVSCQACRMTAVSLFSFRQDGGPKWDLIAELCLSCHHVDATQYLAEKDVEWVRTCEAAARKLGRKADGPYRMSA